MRDEELVGIAAIAVNAETARLHAEVLVAVTADPANAAADPRIDQAHLTDFAVSHVRANRYDLAHGLVSERQRQLDAAVFYGKQKTADEIQSALPNVQVGMT